MARPRKNPEPVINSASDYQQLATHMARKEAVVSAEPQEEMYPEPIKLLYNYRPAGAFKVVVRENDELPGSPMVEREPIGEAEILDERRRVVVAAKDEYAKVPAGSIVRLSRVEARRLLMLRKAEITDVAI